VSVEAQTATSESQRGRRNGAEPAPTRPQAGGDAGALYALGNGYLQARFGAGDPLPQGTRADMESRFGRDLSAVRVHTGPDAADAAQRAGAAAFTIGTDIVFGHNADAGDGGAGRRVLAHELAHTLQQAGARPPSSALATSAPADASEREADALAGAALTGAPIPVIAHREAHIARQPAPAAPAAVPAVAGPMTRAQFDAEMRRRFGTADVHTGTQAEQQSMIPAGVTWHAWDPGPASAAYQDIIDGVLALNTSFGGIPRISSVIFFAMHYERDKNGVLVANPSVGASYGVGTLTIYEHAVNAPDTGREGVPFARSDPSNNYPGGPIIGMAGRGETPGAPVAIPTQRESTMRIIEHELGHGLAEAAQSPTGGTPPDPGMIDQYARGAGWFNGHLYDVGVLSVHVAIAAGTQPPAAYEITPPRWNDPAWKEQPVSRYSVEGGPGEDFAEAVMLYVTSPTVLAARSFQRFLFIDVHKAMWRSRLSTPKP